MKRPCVALDVSKGSSHYQGWINEDKKLGTPKKIEHNQEGFQEILAKAKELEGITNEKPIVVFEATGVYHRTLQHFLEENGMDYIIVSPLASAKVRKSNIRSTKTDKKDCKNIAKVYYSKNLKIHGKGDEIYDRMLDLNRYYQYLTSQLKKIKVQFRLILDIVFPNIDKLWGGTLWRNSNGHAKEIQPPKSAEEQEPRDACQVSNEGNLPSLWRSYKRGEQGNRVLQGLLLWMLGSERQLPGTQGLSFAIERKNARTRRLPKSDYRLGERLAELRAAPIHSRHLR